MLKHSTVLALGFAVGVASWSLAPTAFAGQMNGTLNTSLNGTLNGNLNGTLNGNLNGTLNGNLNGTLNGNVNTPAPTSLMINYLALQGVRLTLPNGSEVAFR
jgi:hypothetical protein